ncbi:MAG: hypothetical protein RBU37_01895 [Myxococcota bacterium]|jgi:hypothetical protein|nr:hypothetical protein [Myxococcota bacterium]
MFLLVLLFPLVSLASPPQLVVVTGVKSLELSEVLEAMGEAPAQDAARQAWGEAAVLRIESLYHRQDYAYARAWFVIDEANRALFDVDEGVMDRIIFRGINAYDALVYRVVLNLPNNVFHRPTLESALEELKRKYGILNIEYRVDDVDESALSVPSPLGIVAPLRELNIFVLGSESFGVGFAMPLDATYGLLPRVGFRFRDLLLDDDRFGSKLELSIPYRRYFFDAKPKFQWVRGFAGVLYRFPPFLEELLSSAIELDVMLSNNARADVGLDGYYFFRTNHFGKLNVLLRALTLSLALGISYSQLFAITESQAATVLPSVDASVLRYATGLTARYTFFPDATRLDLLSDLVFGGQLAVDSAARLFLELQSKLQYVIRIGPHDFILRTQIIYQAGAVHVIDEQQLGGSYQRVYFGGRYWVRQAAWLELAVRLALWRDKIKLGVFNDLTLFMDRSHLPERFALAEGFGPSLHFVFFDQFGLDLYYGFGFAPSGFDHNLSLSLYSLY